MAHEERVALARTPPAPMPDRQSAKQMRILPKNKNPTEAHLA
jgi:hypothetical protein